MQGQVHPPTVHPRVCGEQSDCPKNRHGHLGSSPRVRGTVAFSVAENGGRRFIPACAGNSRRHFRSWSDAAVHPRVCGEQVRIAIDCTASNGSSPRVRGTGNLLGANDLAGRFIPACAGNSIHSVLFVGYIPGSSPRVRGTANQRACCVCKDRFIPACAGNSRSAPVSPVIAAVHPRVCGEQSVMTMPSSVIVGSSPRVRGTEIEAASGWPFFRFIPACAGNSLPPP